MKRIRRTTMSEFLKDVLGDPDEAIDLFEQPNIKEGIFKVNELYADSKPTEDASWMVALARLEDED